MSLVDLLRSPWAILPDRLAEMQAIYARHLHGETVDLDAIEARLGRKLANEKPAFELRAGGVALLEIGGAIAPKANLFTQISGGVSAQELVSQIEAMGDSAQVRAVVLAWDSPGGSVQGIPTLTRAIQQLAELKPVVSVADGTMASAAYWAGSGANAIFASGETDTVGSIGVVATHTYDPRRTQTQVTEVVAGRYKRIASDRKPLSAEGEAYLQAQVDEIYSVFVETVAANRQVLAEDVLTHMADGRTFIGRQALAAGLIDGFMTAEQAVEALASNPGAFARRRRAALPMAASQSTPVTQDTTSREEPIMPTAQEVLDKFKAENPEAAALALAAGAEAERARIQAVRDQLIPGHEALIERLAADGKTTGPQAAVAVLAAERALRTTQAAARQADAPKPVTQEPAPSQTSEAPSLGRQGRLGAGENIAELDRRARAYQAEHPKATYLEAVKAVQALAAA